MNPFLNRLLVSAALLVPCCMLGAAGPASGLRLNEKEYLSMPGLNVMLAHDYYAEGHQGGVGILLNGLRIATNGDLRLEATPGQWSPIPAAGKRVINRETGEISVRMSFPDPTRNRTGFNPIEYPDLDFSYVIRIRPEGARFRIVVDLDKPLPEAWQGKVGFNLELFPGYFFGHTWESDSATGLFPWQAEGPGRLDENREYQVLPLAEGRRLTLAPDSRDRRMQVEDLSGVGLSLLDGRGRHNNGWFVLRSPLKKGATQAALDWLVTPQPIEGWLSKPVIQVSQVGYHPLQPKQVLVEQDPADTGVGVLSLVRVSGDKGPETVVERVPEPRGDFLRYRYFGLDFSQVTQPGIYVVRYRGTESAPFRIDPKVFARGVWQPTVEYFLPVQMCHMRVVDRYRVWHGHCHLDDALMAPVNLNHFDGYVQGPSTLCQYQPGQHVPGLDRGGWHDAGDYDLRVESQAETVHFLALAWELFGRRDDNTTIDQDSRVATLNRPDGRPDLLQQVEHGVLSMVGGYKSMGRLYRGIQDASLGQYTHLGDASTVTDNRVSFGGPGDDRWVFTEQNPGRELQVAAGLAASSRALKGFNDDLAQDALGIARALWLQADACPIPRRAGAALELLIATGDPEYVRFFEHSVDELCTSLDHVDWLLARSLAVVPSQAYKAKVLAAFSKLRAKQADQETRTPYGIPYEPDIWGAGWQIQHHGVAQYFLHTACPELFPATAIYKSLDFILGVHPGSNTSTFVTGVGARSMAMAYGVNRADNAGIPGGVYSGTALIRPDFPELLEWPYLWQQTEYCLGAPTSEYVFLVQAVERLLEDKVAITH